MPERWACCTLMSVKTVEPSDIWGEKDTLVEAAKFVDQNTTADIIDINMGCPVPKITKCDAGAEMAAGSKQDLRNGIRSRRSCR